MGYDVAADLQPKASENKPAALMETKPEIGQNESSLDIQPSVNTSDPNKNIIKQEITNITEESSNVSVFQKSSCVNNVQQTSSTPEPDNQV